MKHYALALFALIGANAALASFVSFDGEWDFYRCGNKWGGHGNEIRRGVPETLVALKAAPGAPCIWVNTLWDSLSAKHSDFAALTDPDANWGWWLGQGVTMIQTDYAPELLVYLMRKGRRDF